MNEGLISKKTRTEFRNFLGNWTLQEITDEFEAAGVECDKEYDPGLSGARKSLVERYYHSLDFAEPSDVRRLLQVYESILNAALRAAGNQEPSAESDRLSREVQSLAGFLRKDGFDFQNGQIVPVSQDARAVFGQGDAGNSVSEVTRRNIIDLPWIEGIPWYGRLNEIDFLDRVFDLDSLPSHDSRFRTAKGDIRQHRIRNCDWENDWVWEDRRFRLVGGPDEVFLRFLCEMIHPVVRPDEEEVQRLLRLFNNNLVADGWEIAERTRLSGRPVFAARRLVPGAGHALEAARSAVAVLGSDRIHQQITRMEAAVHQDPELAIGTAKEFVETICKTILDARGGTYAKDDDLPRLVKLTLKELRLTAEDAPTGGALSKLIRRLAGGLSGVAQGVAELRNLQGTGHGRSA